MAADEIRLSTVSYRDGDLALEGILALPEGGGGSRPGVLLIPAVFGLTEHARDRARRIAALGYAVLVADLHGGGAAFSSLEEAMPRGGALMANVSAWRARLNAGLNALAEQPSVDRHRLAVIGFCFGGTGALELACSGATTAAPLRAAVSFHGGLNLPKAASVPKVEASILVCTGAEDPLVPQADVEAFQERLRACGAEWQVHTYGCALHGFTDPAADTFGTPAAGYNKSADRRSWEAMAQLLNETIGPRSAEITRSVP